ncbi:MAG: GatB/YqeY domain-containing protein [Dehalococcoidia bacterium]|nr:GatB/YqeY domain-containing protein [Dehalococcoidia bacterium]
MKEKIFQDLKEAMRAQDVARRTTLRMVVAAIKNLEIETSSELEDGDVLQIIQKQVKSRRESIEEFRKGNREDLIAKEQTEIDILKEYLPEEANAEDIRSAAAEIITSINASGPQDIGKVMPKLIEQFQGRADGRTINGIVRELLDK